MSGGRVLADGALADEVEAGAVASWARELGSESPLISAQARIAELKRNLIESVFFIERFGCRAYHSI